MGAGNDEVDAGAGDDVVVGGDGNDRLYGGGERDLLIGGRGQDRIYGQAGEDILIAGTTDYDNNLAAVDVIMSEWTRAIAYATRVVNVVNGNGLLMGTGVRLDRTNTLDDDGDYDILEGNGDRDLFFYNYSGAGMKDKVNDLTSSGGNAESRYDLN